MGETTPTCACGCGQPLPSPTYWRREPQRYLLGHYVRSADYPRPLADAVLAALREAGPLGPGQLAARLGKPRRTVAVTLSVLKGRGMARQVRRGLWAVAEQRDEGRMTPRTAPARGSAGATRKERRQ